MTVSFSKYLPWQALHFLQRSTHFSKTCCRQLIASKFLASQLPFHGWKNPEIAWGEIWTMVDVLMGFYLPIFPSLTQNSIQISPHSKWSTVCSTFSRSGWSVVRSASLAKGGTSKKRPSPHFHKVPTRSNDVSPRTFQTAPLTNPMEQSSSWEANSHTVKFTAFYGTRRFITVSTTARH
jgi:hypothetical protein